MRDARGHAGGHAVATLYAFTLVTLTLYAPNLLYVCMYVLKTGHACLVPPSQRNSSSGRPYTTQRWGTRRPDLPTMTTSGARALEFSSTRSLATCGHTRGRHSPRLRIHRARLLLSSRPPPSTNPHCDTGNARPSSRRTANETKAGLGDNEQEPFKKPSTL